MLLCNIYLLSPTANVYDICIYIRCISGVNPRLGLGLGLTLYIYDVSALLPEGVHMLLCNIYVLSPTAKLVITTPAYTIYIYMI